MASVRIYAFAKELKLDNRQLLEICESCGIRGKGSALASLDDDEIAIIRKHMKEGATGTVPASAEKPRPFPAPIRESGPPLPVRNDSLMSRRDNGVRDLNQRAKKPGDSSETNPDKREPRRKSGLNVKLVDMPQVVQPSATPLESREKVQKPDITLPQDAIAKARSGAAPLEQFTRQTTDKPKKKGRGDAPKRSGDPTILGDMPLGSASSAAGKRGSRRDRGEPAGEGDVDSGMGSTRQQRTKRRRTRPGIEKADERNQYNRRGGRHRAGPVTNTAAPRKETIELQLPCTVREFSEAAGIPAVQVLLTTRQLGDESNRTINSSLEDEMVGLLIEHLGVTVNLRRSESLEDSMLAMFDDEQDDPANLKPRPPIVTFLGHVDHGKTSLLDSIIGINVVSGEAGGITQHIRAYEIEKGGQKIAFVDTPGHEAFTEMRARGANVTDIAVLVIAADDGVMPQTEEAISHAKAAGVPIVVALNKIDLPGVNAEKTLQDLARHELLPSEWGGEIEVVRTSATQGTGMDELLETILVTAELHEYKANANRPARGTCLEAEQQSGEGVMVKFIVQNGTLKLGDVVVCGAAHGRVKAMYNTLHTSRKLDEAGPSTPVNLTGLDIAPEAGDKFYVLDDIAQARELAEARGARSRQQSLSGGTTRISLEEIQSRLESGDLKDPNAEVINLNLIIRADVRGSIEAIQKELGKISHPEIHLKILQALVGGITVADVRLAQASEAVIIGFNVVPDETARSLADDVQVEIRRYDIIYKVTDDLKAMLEGRLKPEEQVVELGMAMVLQTFNISRTGTIAGCRVMRGNLQRDCRIRVIRDSRIIGDYPIDSLKRVKDDAKEVQRGMECGIKLVGFNDVKEGDTLEAYKIEEVARTL